MDANLRYFKRGYEVSLSIMPSYPCEGQSL